MNESDLPSLGDLPPLGSDLQSLLRDEQAAPAMPDAMAARIRERLAISLTGVPLSAPDAAEAVGATTATAEASTGILATLAAKPLLIAAAAFATGIGVGVGGTQYFSKSVSAPMQPLAETRVAIVSIDAGVAALPAYDAASSPDVVAPVVEPTAPARLPSKKEVAPPPTPTQDRGLAAERALIELSRTALTRRDAKTALAHLAEHASGFAKGRLAEERDALRIQAYVLDHAYTKAKAQAQAFETRYPKSVFLPVVRNVIAGLP
tara:strand:+ start:33328 stop:34116 length:789 start_codon:yes stop_codon:yes gene_type:complete